MPKASRRLTPSEHQIQSAYFEIVRANRGLYPDLNYARAFPNGGLRPFKVDKRGNRYSPVAKKLHDEGVEPGPLDVIIPARRVKDIFTDYCGLWIEFKKPGEKMSPAQVDYSTYLGTQGWMVPTCYDAEEAWKLTVQYLRLSK